MGSMAMANLNRESFDPVPRPPESVDDRCVPSLFVGLVQIDSDDTSFFDRFIHHVDSAVQLKCQIGRRQPFKWLPLRRYKPRGTRIEQAILGKLAMIIK